MDVFSELPSGRFYGSCHSAWSKDQQPFDAVVHLSYELGELSQWLCHDDSTIKIFLGIILFSFFLSTSIKPQA